MASAPSDFQTQLDKLIEKEKTARINNDHLVSVSILKDIVTPITFRSHSAETRRNGKDSMTRSPIS